MHWIAIRTESQREKVIAKRLVEEIGCTIYLPVVRVRPTWAKKPFVVPLFRPYCFADLDASSTPWQAIRRHAGVVAVIMSGDAPGRCPTSEVEKLKAAEIDGIVQLAGQSPPPPDRRPAIGQTVQIKFGGLAGHEARYLAHKGANRARVVVHLLGREVVVEVASGALTEIAAEIVAPAA